MYPLPQVRHLRPVSQGRGRPEQALYPRRLRQRYQETSCSHALPHRCLPQGERHL